MPVPFGIVLCYCTHFNGYSAPKTDKCSSSIIAPIHREEKRRVESVGKTFSTLQEHRKYRICDNDREFGTLGSDSRVSDMMDRRGRRSLQSHCFIVYYSMISLWPNRYRTTRSSRGFLNTKHPDAIFRVGVFVAGF